MQKPRTLALVSSISLFAVLGITVQVCAQNTRPTSASQTDAKAQGKIFDQYGKLPLSFEANQGQADARVKFLSHSAGYTLFLTSDEAVFSLRGNKAKDNTSGAIHQLRPGPAVPTTNAVLRMKLVNSNPTAKVTGADELAGTSNYFIGNDPNKWRSNVLTYAKVKYEGVYSGIDLVYYGNQRQLEYDFVVAPGADPHQIQFNVQGAKRIRRDEHGDLILKIGEGEIRWHKPVVYQERNGAREEIAARYAIGDKYRVAFEVASYDESKPLYIDPLIYSTFLGGSGVDGGFGIAVDSAGNAYVAGYTSSTNFPTMNPLQPAHGSGNTDAFVVKFNPSGSALVYSTYLGGSGNQNGYGIAVDSAGNAYVTGVTGSTNFPTMNPLQPVIGGGVGGRVPDAFVSKLNPSGTALVYSTYLGGSRSDEAYGITVDSAGNAYVTGYTDSIDFPIMNPLQPAGGGYIDAFVAKLNPSGSALLYSTYLNGSDGGYAVGQGIAADSAGNAYVTGYTDSTTFPTMNPLQVANGGGTADAFVAKFNPSGSALVYSTYLGGSGFDNGFGIAVDSVGNAYVTGWTTSTDFPTINAVQTANGGGFDAFVAKLNATGSALVYSTYLGGSLDDFGFGIAVDSPGDAYVIGQAGSTDFPTMNPFQPTHLGSGFNAFVTELNSTGSALVYSTYLGGSGSDEGHGIAVDSTGNAYVTGQGDSADFPTMDPFQATHLGSGFDAFVAKIASAGPRYSVCLLYDPTKAVRSGATIPIKLQLCDGTGNDLSSSSITVHAISISQISTSTSGAVEDSGDSNPDNDFRFDASLGSTGGYIFNIKTTGLTTGTYRVHFMVAGDSFVYEANFQVK